MDVIPLHLGVSHFNTPGVAVEAIHKALSKHDTFYGPTEGLPDLRYALAQRYLEDEGVPVPAEQILITHGAKHAIHLYLQSLLQPDDEVIALAPYWFAFPELIRQSGGKLVTVPANPEQGYSLNVEQIRQKVSPDTRLLILTNPGNPTGKVYSVAELQQVAHLLDEFPNLHLLSDEIYDGLGFDGPVPSFIRFEHLRNRVAVINGFSKSFAMSGWRVGYLIAPFEVLHSATELQRKLISGVSPFVQAGAVAATQHRHQIWKHFRQDLEAKRERVRQELELMPKLKFTLPDAGYYVTLQVDGCLQAQDPASPFMLVEEWAAALKDQVGLEVLSATNMGMTNAVRMSYALPEDILENALLRLKAFVS
ncbi:pyridoxal phosphate-dependent aminotransferase [Rufibacter latericius]|uniref:Aminotransferase n=1 Tax=Rufibacter latericius TaxID=2487040 RepID=A0A3M9MIM6_9BACT|nr:aminotransferase class I/II-fold pyridoxal phosphate-dependent enzyme [Rufibacter latericius]RNI25007.1 aminotransferase class I/II-fold pyridoxal phosphate-dependent enzyme [Rufibacter latericius]